jgi:hypothetical protein
LTFFSKKTNIILYLSAPAAKYLTETDKSGGQKRSAESSENNEEDESTTTEDDFSVEGKHLAGSDNESEISTESEEEQQSNPPAVATNIMPARKSAPAKTPVRKVASAKKKPSSTTGGDEGMMDTLTSRFNKVVMTDSGESGFNFNCMFPYEWYTFQFGGIKYTVYDFLMWCSSEDDVSFKISKNGWKLHVTNTLVGTFFLSINAGTARGIHWPPRI